MTHLLAEIWRDEAGATVIEYTMILALVFLAMITGVATLGESLSSIFSMVGGHVTTAINAQVPPS